MASSFENTVEIADVFRADFNTYLNKNGNVPSHYYKIVNAITHCRTDYLGGHIYTCDSCNHEITLYNSCRDRHCPKCQAMAQAIWVKKRMEEVLPVQYFHIVFTVPHQLNPIVLRNKWEFYTIMFKAVSETLLELGKDQRRLNGQIGFIAVLHSWGQNLMDHNHIHCLIPGGALNTETWISTKKDLLFPVPVMRKLFRGKFMHYFTKAVKNGKITTLSLYKQDEPTYDDIIGNLYKTKWVVYAKKPFDTPDKVVKYLAKYTHRVAISNKRILSFEDGKVTFTYKDYADNNKTKKMTLSSIEFIRRFMLHILPVGFMKIRQYGFLSNKVKQKKLTIIRENIQASIDTTIFLSKLDKSIKAISIKEPLLCPHCNKGALVKTKKVLPVHNYYAKVSND